MKGNIRVFIKGGGEMASGVAWRLYQSHFQVVMTEVHEPMAVRRGVSFCEAVYEGRKTIEGVEAILVDRPEKVHEAWYNFQIPIIIDPNGESLGYVKPDVLIEATLSKRNIGISLDDAPLVIALGPGYEAGHDAHLVVETNRGHHLGRLYTLGSAQENTGVPGDISGFSLQRVLRAPVGGIFVAKLALGDLVEGQQLVGSVSGEPVVAQINGILRGLLRPGIQIRAGTKVGDIDPRCEKSYVNTISEKARAIGGSVLEGICRKYNH